MYSLVFSLVFLLQQEVDTYIVFDLHVKSYLAENTGQLRQVSSKVKELISLKQLNENLKRDIVLLDKNIDAVLGIDMDLREKFFVLKKRFEYYFSMIAEPKNLFHIYEKMVETEREMSELGKGFELLIYFCSVKRMDLGNSISSKILKEEELIKEFSKYKKLFGENSLFLTDIKLVLIEKMIFNGKFKEIINDYPATVGLIEKYVGSDSRRMFCLKTYIMKSYIEISDFKKAQETLDGFKNKDVEAKCKGMYIPLSLYYSTASLLSERNNKLLNAVAFQELALANLVQFRGKESPEVKTEAIRLRDLMANRNEWTQLRNLEERYGLKPLPIQPGEK